MNKRYENTYKSLIDDIRQFTFFDYPGIFSDDGFHTSLHNMLNDSILCDSYFQRDFFNLVYMIKKYDNLIISDEQLAKLKEVKNTSESNCIICMNEINKGELMLILDCEHSFHKGCITQWLKNFRSKGSCPICRAYAINKHQKIENFQEIIID